MRCVLRGLAVVLAAAMLAAASPLHAQEAPDSFRWVDFHSPKDQDVIVWVTKAMEAEKWTAIREIGVDYDAALVLTTLRSSPKAAANADTFSLWSVSLTNHLVTPLIQGVNLRWTDWIRLATGAPAELGLFYDDCRECAATTYFTTLHYDISRHQWATRWMQGGRAVAVWSANPPPGVQWTQVFAVLADPNGIEMVGTWSHFEYGGKKAPADFVYQYDLDPWTHLERIQQLSGTLANEMELRLCRADDTVTGLARGQDSPICQQYVRLKYERKPVTTPPNNQGRSAPPGTRH